MYRYQNIGMRGEAVAAGKKVLHLLGTNCCFSDLLGGWQLPLLPLLATLLVMVILLYIASPIFS